MGENTMCQQSGVDRACKEQIRQVADDVPACPPSVAHENDDGDDDEEEVEEQ